MDAQPSAPTKCGVNGCAQLLFSPKDTKTHMEMHIEGVSAMTEPIDVSMPDVEDATGATHNADDVVGLNTSRDEGQAREPASDSDSGRLEGQVASKPTETEIAILKRHRYLLSLTRQQRAAEMRKLTKIFFKQLACHGLSYPMGRASTSAYDLSACGSARSTVQSMRVTITTVMQSDPRRLTSTYHLPMAVRPTKEAVEAARPRPYKCGVAGCNMAFANTQGLGSHNTTHVVPPFKCADCGRNIGGGEHHYEMHLRYCNGTPTPASKSRLRGRIRKRGREAIDATAAEEAKRSRPITARASISTGTVDRDTAAQ